MDARLYGTVPNFASGCEGDDAFYVFNRAQVGPTRWRFEGDVGYGCTAEEFVEFRRSIGEDLEVADVDPTPHYCVPIHQTDMKEFVFEFDTETRVVDIGCTLRCAGHPDDAEHSRKLTRVEFVMPTEDEIAARLEKRVATLGEVTPERMVACLERLKDYMNADWNTRYLEIRFPRTKDGIAVTLVLEHMLAAYEPIRIRYSLAYETY
jgi:hypothetical protein